MTDDEKAIVYDDVKRKRSLGKRNETQLILPKLGLHSKNE